MQGPIEPGFNPAYSTKQQLIIAVLRIPLGMSKFSSKLGQIGPTWHRSGTFKISFSQNLLKLILKNPRFVPFGVNLIQFGCKIWHPCTTRFAIPSGDIKASLSSIDHLLKQQSTSTGIFWPQLLTANLAMFMLSCSGVSDMGSNMVRLAPNGTKF